MVIQKPNPVVGVVIQSPNYDFLDTALEQAISHQCLVIMACDF